MHYPVLKIPKTTLQFTPWQTFSIEKHFDISGEISAMLQLMRDDYMFMTIYCQLLVHTYDYTRAMWSEPTLLRFDITAHDSNPDSLH